MTGGGSGGPGTPAGPATPDGPGTSGGSGTPPWAGPVERLRQICLGLPEVSERISHGEPTWFVQGKKTLVTLDDHHHGADHLAFWCPAAPGVQADLVDQEPQRFFRPPYVGGRGWLGVRIDLDPDWEEVAAIVADAYRLVAPRRLAARLDAVAPDAVAPHARPDPAA